MELSLFGRRFASGSAILDLMDDLGKAMESPQGKLMLGGGNPASIPEVNQVWRRRWAEILAKEGEVEAVVAQYDAPAGRDSFRKAMAEFLVRNYDWNVGPENIVVTGGSQSASFLLFNLLAGPFSNHRSKKILFPLAPEYVGYADQALAPNQFESHRPRIVEEGAHRFKYYVDFGGLEVGPSVGALCAGRPTNPTGNVLTDDEVRHLATTARAAGIPFLLDNAYGAPFPSILFEPVTPYWDDNTIVTLSLSKLGLPSARTGIVVAPEPIARALSSANSILNLTNAGLGQALVQPLLEDDSLLELCRLSIRPFYEKCLRFALGTADSILGGKVDYRIHRPEGSLFLWFWFPRLAIDTRTLYQRLKQRGLLVIPGESFFFGLPPADENWTHRRQCLRINYARAPEEVEAGLKILAQEVLQAQVD